MADLSEILGLQPYDGTPPHVANSDTSTAAAEEIQPKAPSMRTRVYEFVAEWGSATDEEIEIHLDMRHQTASARRRELVLLGLLVDSGERRPTTSGRPATVWELA